MRRPIHRGQDSQTRTVRRRGLFCGGFSDWLYYQSQAGYGAGDVPADRNARKGKGGCLFQRCGHNHTDQHGQKHYPRRQHASKGCEGIFRHGYAGGHCHPGREAVYPQGGFCDPARRCGGHHCRRYGHPPDHHEIGSGP